MALLEIKDLCIRFRTLRGEVHAVNGVDLEVDAGDTVALVGESGSGKSVTALAILRLLAKAATVTRGSITFDGVDVLGLGPAELQRLRGGSASMVFQDPMTSLNPVMTVGAQICEVVEAHTDLRRKQAMARAVELLEQVGIPEPASRANQYPHQFSGGMRQRAMIAIAIACRPRLLIADEPTTALDVTVQAQIMTLLRSLIDSYGMGLLLITHDLGVVAGTCRETNVMYGGRIVERSDTRALFHAPMHPYTKGLLHSIPSMTGARKSLLATIDGQPPVLTGEPTGCSFAPRCDRRVEETCWDHVPRLAGEDRHVAACWNPLVVTPT